jgi:hypothetical protein
MSLVVWQVIWIVSAVQTHAKTPPCAPLHAVCTRHGERISAASDTQSKTEVALTRHPPELGGRRAGGIVRRHRELFNSNQGPRFMPRPCRLSWVIQYPCLKHHVCRHLYGGYLRADLSAALFPSAYVPSCYGTHPLPQAREWAGQPTKEHTAPTNAARTELTGTSTNDGSLCYATLI